MLNDFINIEGSSDMLTVKKLYETIILFKEKYKNILTLVKKKILTRHEYLFFDIVKKIYEYMHDKHIFDEESFVFIDFIYNNHKYDIDALNIITPEMKKITYHKMKLISLSQTELDILNTKILNFHIEKYKKI